MSDCSCCLTFSQANIFSLNINYKEMQTKWKVFIITFFSYALIHGARTSWSSLKYTMNSPPYHFSPVFLGTLDMLVLVTLAISINLFGPKVVSGGPKQYLQKGMVVISVVLIILGLLLFFTVKMEVIYALVYPLIGVFSCVGWPACIYILSLYFQKGMIFSLWNGCIQFGDFATILLSFIFVQAIQVNAGVFLFVIAGTMFGVGLLVKTFLSEVLSGQTEPLPEASPGDRDRNAENLTDEKDIPSNCDESQTHEIRPKKKVNFITVWTLPGVSGYILSFIFVKTVYAMISTWLVFYLDMISMVAEAHIIALLWSSSTFIGGILGIKINKKFKRKYFIFSLFVAALFFVFLEQMHLYPNQLEIIILIAGCGLAFGGPYTIMNSSIPLYLSEKPVIKQYPGAKAAIISAMEGYSLLFCGITLIFVPTIGVFDLHWVAFCYCVVSALILSRQSYLEYEDKIKAEGHQKKYSSEPVIKGLKERQFEMSANLQGAKDGKKRRKIRKKSMRSLQSQQKSSKEQSQSKESTQNNPSSKNQKIQKTGKQSQPPFHSNQLKEELISPERDNKQKKIDSEQKFFEKEDLIVVQSYHEDESNPWEYKEMNQVQQDVNE